MRLPAKFVMAVSECLLCLSLSQPKVAWAQEDYRHPATNSDAQGEDGDHRPVEDRSLSEDDRLSIIAAALNTKVRRSQRDCSHLVHAVYAQAGLPYSYAPSSEIYAGVEDFQRVKRPEPGDLIVWRGHVGIVVKPSQHIFFSYLRSGPGIDDYQAAYWKKRGRPRFYRYVKSSCEACDSPRRLVKLKR